MMMMERFSWSRSFPKSTSSLPPHPPSLSRKSGDKERRRRSRFFCSPSSLSSSSFHPKKNRRKITKGDEDDDDDDDDHHRALIKADGFGTSTTTLRRRGARAKVRAISRGRKGRLSTKTATFAFSSSSSGGGAPAGGFNNDNSREEEEEERKEEKGTTLENGIVIAGATTTTEKNTKEEDAEKNDDALSDDQPRWSGEPSAADANGTEMETTTTTAITPPQPPATTSGYTRKWKKRDLSWARDAIPFYVMLPLDVVSRDGVLENKEVLEVALDALARVGVDGVMVDVWWGIVERKRPRNYDWTPYYELFQICEKLGLKVQAVMSFHACGANVGDVYEIKLPDWVLESGIQDPDLFFTDQYGYRNPECISLWADDARTVAGRTPRECYRDFMVSFRDTFENLLQSTISEIAVGCGPCGELRYPSYPENKRSPNSSQWRFPGIGEFQCYDQRALGALARHAAEVGRIEWGGSGPHDCGGYNNLPQETGFFRADRGSWDSEYGQFFLDWYAKELVKHGDKTLQTTREVFDYEKTGVDVAIKCAGVHWWYNSRSHAAELTAGYFNTRSGDFVPERDGYEPIVKICAKYNARLNFTCVEMVDGDHPWFSRCGPEGLLRQIRTAAAKYNVRVAGENALCRFDRSAYERVIKNARGEGDDVELWKTGEKLPPMACFTFLRMSRELFELYNFNSFKEFVKRMKAATVRDNLRLSRSSSSSSSSSSSLNSSSSSSSAGTFGRPGGAAGGERDSSSFFTTNSTNDNGSLSSSPPMYNPNENFSTNNTASSRGTDVSTTNSSSNGASTGGTPVAATGNAYIDNYNNISQNNSSNKSSDSMDSIDEDDYELEDGFADRGEAPPLQEQVQSIVQLMNEL
jgi:beta-amylase